MSDPYTANSRENYSKMFPVFKSSYFARERCKCLAELKPVLIQSPFLSEAWSLKSSVRDYVVFDLFVELCAKLKHMSRIASAYASRDKRLLLLKVKP